MIESNSEINKKTYISMYDSSLFYVSINQLDITKTIDTTGYVKLRIECKVPGLGYPDKDLPGYDPRCRD